MNIRRIAAAFAAALVLAACQTPKTSGTPSQAFPSAFVLEKDQAKLVTDLAKLDHDHASQLVHDLDGFHFVPVVFTITDDGGQERKGEITWSMCGAHLNLEQCSRTRTQPVTFTAVTPYTFHKKEAWFSVAQPTRFETYSGGQVFSCTPPSTFTLGSATINLVPRVFDSLRATGSPGSGAIKVDYGKDPSGKVLRASETWQCIVTTLPGVSPGSSVNATPTK